MTTRYRAVRLAPEVPGLEDLPAPAKRRIRKALGLLGDLKAFQTCGHDGSLRFWCTRHPRSGFKCAACLEKHLRRKRGHDRCLSCAGDTHARANPPVRAQIATDTTGRDGRLDGVLARWIELVGVGACGDCRRAAVR